MKTNRLANRMRLFMLCMVSALAVLPALEASAAWGERATIQAGRNMAVYIRNGKGLIPQKGKLLIPQKTMPKLIKK